MKIALITTDSRDHFRQYEREDPYFGTAPQALLEGFAGREGVEVHVLSCIHRPMSSPTRLASNIYYHSVVVPPWGWMRSLYWGCRRSLQPILDAIMPDIVHGQGTEKECALAAVFSGRPNVVTIHGNMAAVRPFASGWTARTFYWMAEKLERLALRRTGGVFCNSDYTLALVQRHARKTWRVDNPIRGVFFQPMPERTRSSAKVLLNVGNVCPRKRQNEVLSLVRVLHEQGVRVQVRFAGTVSQDGGYGSEFLKRVHEGEIAGYARYLGSLDERHLLLAMDEVDAFLHWPSEEAFGLVVAEAMARGLKFFGSAVGGVKDICRGVEGAELFPPDAAAGLSAALNAWSRRDVEFYPQNQAIMRARYSPEVIAQRHLDIYREVLNRKETA